MDIIGEEFVYLVNLWEDYKTLFTNQDNLNILNKNHGDCFHTIQHSMNNDMVLSLNRLLDPYRQGSNKNLVLESLLEKVNDTSTKSKLEVMLHNIRNLQVESDLKEIRNKRLAHSDETTRNGDNSFSVILVQYAVVEKIIKLINEFLNEIHNYLTGDRIEYLKLIKTPSCQDLVDALDRENKN